MPSARFWLSAIRPATASQKGLFARSWTSARPSRPCSSSWAVHGSQSSGLSQDWSNHVPAAPRRPVGSWSTLGGVVRGQDAPGVGEDEAVGGVADAAGVVGRAVRVRAGRGGEAHQGVRVVVDLRLVRGRTLLCRGGVEQAPVVVVGERAGRPAELLVDGDAEAHRAGDVGDGGGRQPGGAQGAEDVAAVVDRAAVLQVRDAADVAEGGLVLRRVRVGGRGEPVLEVVDQVERSSGQREPRGVGGVRDRVHAGQARVRGERHVEIAQVALLVADLGEQVALLGVQRGRIGEDPVAGRVEGVGLGLRDAVLLGGGELVLELTGASGQVLRLR